MTAIPLEQVTFNIDIINNQNIAGWVLAENDKNLYVSVFEKNQLIALQAVHQKRPDVTEKQPAGFHIYLPEPLQDIKDVKVLFFKKELLTELQNTLIGDTQISNAVQFYDYDKRWKNDEPDVGLTWGVFLEGDSFFEMAQKFCTFSGSKKVIEIGPGYGRLWQSLQHQPVVIDAYVGVDLSEARIRRLTQEFGNSFTQFRVGDARSVILSSLEKFNLLISSSTFEHISPDFGLALQHLAQFLDRGALAIFDLIDNGEPTFSDCGGCPSGVYVRSYSVAELEKITTEAGFKVLGITPYEMRNRNLDKAVFQKREQLVRKTNMSYLGETTAIVHRYLVVAEKV